MYRMLIVNLGGTSSKVAVYQEEKCAWATTLSHSLADLKPYGHYLNQYDYRKKAILEEFFRRGERLEDMAAVVSRCGPVKPVAGGTYRIGEKLVADTLSGTYGEHPSTLGLKFAFELSREYGIKAYTVDPPISNEMCEEAKITGMAGIERMASFQALNHRATARKYCLDRGVKYEDVNIIVCHLGSGITIASHCMGKVIDVNNGLTGDGPFSLERAGTVPSGDLIKLCFSGKYTEQEMIRLVNGLGGLVALLGITDGRVLEERIVSGDQRVALVTRAMAFNIAKEIGANATVMCGKVDGIVLTGGLAHWSRLVDLIRERVEFIAPISLYPGENELDSLAAGAYRALVGAETARDYQ